MICRKIRLKTDRNRVSEKHVNMVFVAPFVIVGVVGFAYVVYCAVTAKDPRFDK